MRAIAVVLGLCVLPLHAEDGLGSLRERMREARRRVFPALVHIVNVEEVFAGARRQRNVSNGSGFFIDAAGHVVTNYHVAGQATRLFVTLASKRKVKAELVAGDPYTDVALLRVDPKEAFAGGEPVFARFGASAALSEGDFVMAMGSPLSLARSVSFGIISCRDRRLDSMRVAGHETGKYNTWLQTDAAINPGNSGGPLVNLDGEVVGVNTRANLAANNIGFAIPSDVVREVVAALLVHRRVPRATLGLRLQALTELADTAFGDVGEGVLVAAVAPGSPAAAAGLRPGDFVTSLDGSAFSARFGEELPTLYRRISRLAPGVAVRLTIRRGGAEQNVDVVPEPLGREVGQQFEVARWGITVRAITAPMTRRLGLPDPSGVVVTGVRPGSPASGALEVGDIVRMVQRDAVGDIESFLRLAAESVRRRDALVRLRLRRGGVDDVTVVRPRYAKGKR